MLPKYPLMFLLILFVQKPSYAQDFKFRGTVGYATFDLSEMRMLQNQIILNSNVPLKKTDAFPAQPYYQIQIMKRVTSNEAFGIFGGFTSTGGRVTVSDYSGKVSSDQLLSAYQAGLHAEKKLTEIGETTLFLQTQLSFLFSILKLKDEVKIADTKIAETTSLISESVAIEPGIGIQLNMLPVPLRFRIGFQFNILDFPFHLKGNRNAILRVNDSKAGANLSGFRLAISSGFEL